MLPDYQSEKVQIFNFGISPNDQIYSHISYQAGTVDFYMEDLTTEKSTSFNENGKGDYDGSSADWIVERPTLGGHWLPYLADFGNVTFTNAYAAIGSDSYPISSWANLVSDVMQDIDGTLARPSSLISSTSFNVSFVQKGEYDYVTSP